MGIARPLESMEDPVGRFRSGDVNNASTELGSIRYELLTGTPETLAVGDQPSVFLVLRLTKALCDEDKEEGNHWEPCKFLDRTQNGPLRGTLSGIVAHEPVPGGKPLACIHEDAQLV